MTIFQISPTDTIEHTACYAACQIYMQKTAFYCSFNHSVFALRFIVASPPWSLILWMAPSEQNYTVKTLQQESSNCPSSHNLEENHCVIDCKCSYDHQDVLLREILKYKEFSDLNPLVQWRAISSHPTQYHCTPLSFHHLISTNWWSFIGWDCSSISWY